MENSKSRSLSVFPLALIGLLTLACVLQLTYILFAANTSVLLKVEIITDILASAVAFIYLVRGYSKSEAKYYKISMFAALVNALVVAVVSTGEKIEYVPLIMCIIAFALIAFLTFGKNLGKKTSYLCCGLLVLIRVSGMISIALTSQDPLTDTSFILVLAQLVLSFTICMIAYAKYRDKTARGTE